MAFTENFVIFNDLPLFWDAAGLEKGRYLIKAYVDANRRLASDPTAMLGPEEFAGQLEVEAKWGVGFRNAEVVSGDGLK